MTGSDHITTTFFTSADKVYEPFVIPYIAAVLIHNPDARVEVCVTDPDAFKASHAQALRIIDEQWPNRSLIRSANFQGVFPNSVRFLETPMVLTEYVYIGDIDILVTEHVTPQHLENMKRIGLPYSNILRPSGDRLSGLHFTKSEAYYPVSLPEGVNLEKENDERLLYRIVELRHPLPPPTHLFRPQHGIHVSLQRSPLSRSRPAWGLNKTYVEQYMALKQSPVWQRLSPHFDTEYKWILLLLEAALETGIVIPDYEWAPSPGCALRNVFRESLARSMAPLLQQQLQAAIEQNRRLSLEIETLQLQLQAAVEQNRRFSSEIQGLQQQLKSTRDDSRRLITALMPLRKWAKEVDRAIGDLAQSKRWRIGNALGNVLDILFLRPRKDTPVNRLLALSASLKDLPQD